MKNHQYGFTMVEIMIFLAVSGAMLSWSVVAIRGRQQSVEFSQTVRSFENTIKDYINDIGTGYYPNATGYSCRVPNQTDPASDITFVSAGAGADTGGTNKDCIFLGKALQVGVLGTTGQGYNTFTVLGRRLYPEAGELRETKTFRESRPAPLLSNGAVTFDYTDQKTLPWGVHVKSASSALIGFFTTFAQSGTRGLQSGSQDTQTIAIPSSGGGVFPTDADQASAVAAIRAYRVDTPAAFTPQTICLERGDNRETALITIGSNGRTTDVKTEFKAC